MWCLVGGLTLVIIIVVVCVLQYKSCKEETYRPDSSINFLSLQQTKHLLETDFDGYGSSLNLTNLKACGVSDFPDLISKWSRSAMGWTLPQQEKLKEAIKLVEYTINTRASILPTKKQLSDIEWNFACTIHPYYLDGLSHTRGDIIFLSDKVVSQISVKTLAGILLHEKIHIWQRKFPEDMQRWIDDKGFVATSHRVFDDLLERSNPDTNGIIYKDLGVKFTSLNPLDLHSVKYNSSRDHPHEQMASEIQKWVD